MNPGITTFAESGITTFAESEPCRYTTTFAESEPCRYTTTFVTCFMNIYETTIDHRTLDWRIDQFRDIARSGIPICLYGCERTTPFLHEFAQPYPNIKIMDLGRPYTDLPIHSACFADDLSLPDCRNDAKDTREYMALMHAKIEFVQHAVQQNPWQTANFAWIDFSMAYMFKRRAGSIQGLVNIAKYDFPTTFFTIPGCWDRVHPDAVDRVLNAIHWRFCGTFFMGDAASITQFYDLYMAKYPEFLEKYKKLVWEVNFWAYLEGVCGWTPAWYSSDHNDRIIEMSADLFSRPLAPVAEIAEYDYPYLDPYIPTSAAYLFHEGKHILNTRYVNYWCYPNGCYLFHDKRGIIGNRNLVCYLSNENDEGILQPIEGSFREMDADSVDLAKREETCFSEGLEDIRLFTDTDSGTVKFIATNVNYSETGRCSIMVGDYDLVNNKYSDCRMIKPPGESWLEKNWIPLSNGQFIYKWSPMEIGHIDPDESRLIIDTTHEIQNLYFHKVRGSTTFVPVDGGGLLGVVHFSEDHSPRHYYHMLVLLEKETYKPLKCSRIFHFESLSVEFCIGFAILGGKYHFWISRFDRDPALFIVDLNDDRLQLNSDIVRPYGM